ncbi:hypothetical protein FACS189499_03870 [Clostridia bacterium]|nr:hypothetical protein FACS189499_03870 [Clostridia bacterium]
MNEKDLLREAMRVTHTTQVGLQNVLGLKGQSSVSGYLNGKSMRVETFVKVLNAIGFEVSVKGHGQNWTLGKAMED